MGDITSIPTPARNNAKYVVTVKLLIVLQAYSLYGAVRDLTLQLSKCSGYSTLSSQARTTKIYSRAKEFPYLDAGHTQSVIILPGTSLYHSQAVRRTSLQLPS
jgi:hypothetical protein